MVKPECVVIPGMLSANTVVSQFTAKGNTPCINGENNTFEIQAQER